ncbi:MAG: SBBP repeat-containing protein [Acidobacteria bacterium]|nr:SBBP repeat-containing protein [Acidobacteriota bacterium]
MLALALFILFSAAPAQSQVESSVNQAYGRLDMSFEPNYGQTDSNVKFMSRGSGYGLFLTTQEAVLRLTRPEPAVVRMKLVGAGKDPVIEGLEPSIGATNYFVGSSNNHRKHVPSYKKVRYKGVYPGIDLLYYGNQRILEYDFVVQPGSDPSRIQLSFSGVDRTYLDVNGNLILDTPGEDLEQKKPVAYQEIDGRRKNVDVAYELRGNRVGFRLGAYDRTKTLVIDPVLAYSSYLGGSATAALGDQGYSIAVDAAGNAYLTGFTSSTDFPVQTPRQGASGGGQDAFVMKLNPAGTAILFSTYLGGSGTDEGHGIAIDSGGNIIVTGYTRSSNFPVVNAVQSTRKGNQEAFVTKLNSSGSAILYSTYLGGGEDDRAFGLATDANGNAYVTGFTGSRDFPILGGFQTNFGGGLSDVFITKLNSNGSLVYSTFAGGNGHDQAYTIGVDPGGNAYVAGFSTSATNFPLQDAAQSIIAGGNDDAFLMKINPSGGALVYSTFFGGIGSDNAVRLVVDAEGSVTVTGITSSPDFPVVNAQFEGLLGSFDAFITKFNPDGQSLAFSTLLGGLGNESGVGIAQDGDGNIYVTGFSDSFELPIVNAVQQFSNGGRDVYIIKLSGDGQTVFYSTYVGGLLNEGALAIAVDRAGNAYVTGFTTSTDFPLANAIQGEIAGSQDGFVFKIDSSDIVSSVPFDIAPQGLAAVRTGGASRQAVFGYATAVAPSVESRPTGLAIITSTQNGAIVSEAGLPAPALITAGRMFVEVNTQERSVISLANPSDEEATVSFYFTNLNGEPSLFSNTTIPPRTHFSRFVSDDPILIAAGETGTLSFESSIPLFATGFHTLTNERSEFLINTLPVADLNKTFLERLVIPHFAAGSGWKSEILLVNNTEEEMHGELRFMSAGTESEPGQPIDVLLVGGEEAASAYGYDIPPRSVLQFETVAGDEEFLSGWIQLIPHGTNTPVGTALLSRTEDLITVTRTNVDVQLPKNAFRLFAEARRNFEEAEDDAVRTAIAIANPSGADAQVRLELIGVDGTPTAFAATVTVPANGQYARFLHTIPGFESIAPPFDGVLRVTSGSNIAVMSARTRLNFRKNFLATTTGPLVEGAGTGSVLVFPHIAEGGGYTSQFFIFSIDGQSTGVIQFLDQEGKPIILTVR